MSGYGWNENKIMLNNMRLSIIDRFYFVPVAISVLLVAIMVKGCRDRHTDKDQTQMEGFIVESNIFVSDEETGLSFELELPEVHPGEAWILNEVVSPPDAPWPSDGITSHWTHVYRVLEVSNEWALCKVTMFLDGFAFPSVELPTKISSFSVLTKIRDSNGQWVFHPDIGMMRGLSEPPGAF